MGKAVLTRDGWRVSHPRRSVKQLLTVQVLEFADRMDLQPDDFLHGCSRAVSQLPKDTWRAHGEAAGLVSMIVRGTVEFLSGEA